MHGLYALRISQYCGKFLKERKFSEGSVFEFGYEAHDDLRVSRGTSKKCAAKEETYESYRLAGSRVTARKMREGA
jgi:hypothetical protein|tara:strand:- start:10339 stop:10563 length:225 start_codon:yes stop_codon:yes gene_type:complete